METDVIVVGAGPVGLMLAAELRLAGVRPLVLERHPELGHTPNANGLGGQVVELLRHRGLLERFAAVATHPGPTIPGYPFGGTHLDLSGLPDPPLKGLRLEHPSVDRILGERAAELGAEVRFEQRVVDLRQDDDAVTATVDGPDGPHDLTARFLVGCDGAHSRVRQLAGIAFPGTTYPEVHRLAELAVPAAATVQDDGGLAVPGVGTVPAGFTRTERGVFAMGLLTPETFMVQTIEDEDAEEDDERAMTLEELGASIGRVLGLDVPLERPRRLSRYRHHARQAERYRAGRVLLAGDAAHVLPATGMARSVGMLDAVGLAWKLAAEVRGRAPDGLLDRYHDERHAAGARAMWQSQAQVALRRGLDEAAEALRELFRHLLTDEQPARRLAALVAGADVRHAPIGLDPESDRHPLTGAFVPDLPLRGAPGPTPEHGRPDDGTATPASRPSDSPGPGPADPLSPAPTSTRELLRTARPLLLDLADRPELREVAAPWADRVDVQLARTDDRPADLLLIRPDAHVAWTAGVDRPTETAGPALEAALAAWFGAP